MTEKILIALKSIGKNKNRNFLTMLGIIIGIASVICILAIGDGFAHTVTKGMGDHNTHNKVILQWEATSDYNTDGGFTSNDAAVLEKIPGVNRVKLTSSIVEAGAKVQYKTKHVSIGLNKQPKHLKLIKGNYFTMDNASNGIYISHDLAQKLFKKNALNRLISVDGTIFVVQGIYSANGMTYRPDAYVSKGIFKQLFASQLSRDEAKMYIQPDASKKRIGKEAVKKMKKMGEQKDTGRYSVSNPDQISKQFTKILNDITYFIAFIAGISLLIAGIGVMNVMYITVSERRKEIGIRRAFGATASDIRNQFLIESVVLCIIGGLIGIALGYGLVAIINAFLPFKAVITTYAIILSLSVSTAVGLVFGFIPSNKAAKSELVGLLKEE
ncbi:ABC transporter permease [Companilactobacillus alimentarius]|uniref:ABC transporter permease n=1 Tax=Companilactobacillus alimentarius TaxID=1602 RepID=UPI0028B3F6DA|nr:ABC transporter permease [Companilactobacillus alimentarius]MDT6952821.1 FtsX-like permease family protein [Companilactobacillus alimentarius]